MTGKNYEIIPLPKEQWEGPIIPIQYTTDTYYDISINKETDGYTIEMRKNKYESFVVSRGQKRA